MYLSSNLDDLEIRVNGAKIERAKEVCPPSKDYPFWKISLEGGGIILATGNVEIEINPKRPVGSKGYRGPRGSSPVLSDIPPLPEQFNSRRAEYIVVRKKT